jgi:hypothetical protein
MVVAVVGWRPQTYIALELDQVTSYDYPVNDSAVLMAANLAWPVVVLIIATLVLASQRDPVGRLIDRIKTLKYPGGQADLGAVPEAGADDLRTLVYRLQRNVSDRAEREEPETAGEAEADETMQNREPLASFEPLPIERVTNLVTLATEAAHRLSELAVPPPPGGFGRPSAMIDTLLGRGVLEDQAAQALLRLVDIADQAARGAMVPPRVAIAVENSGPTILSQLDLLRTQAAARFEDHVLDTLQKRAPREWSIDIDRAIVSDDQPDKTASDAPSATRPRHARVDALVTVGDRSAVVEVRARLQPTVPGQIDAVREWMKALPFDLPVLLIMLGEGLTARQLEQIRDGHGAPVELLLWDSEAKSLIGVLNNLLGARTLRRSEVPA